MQPSMHFLDIFTMSPFVSDADCSVDGTGEGDVVEGVEELGEDVGVDWGLIGEGPLPHWVK